MELKRRNKWKQLKSSNETIPNEITFHYFFIITMFGKWLTNHEMWQLEERKASASSKNGERKNQKGSLPMPPKRVIPKPRFHRVDHWILEDNDSAEKTVQPLPEKTVFPSHNQTPLKETDKKIEKLPVLPVQQFSAASQLVKQVRGRYGKEHYHQFHFSFSFRSSEWPSLELSYWERYGKNEKPN